MWMVSYLLSKFCMSMASTHLLNLAMEIPFLTMKQNRFWSVSFIGQLRYFTTRIGNGITKLKLAPWPSQQIHWSCYKLIQRFRVTGLFTGQYKLVIMAHLQMLCSEWLNQDLDARISHIIYQQVMPLVWKPIWASLIC